MTKILFLWFFSYAFVWWLLWFLLLPLGANADKARRAKGEGSAGSTRRFLGRKALVVSLLAALLTTLLVFFSRL